MDKFEYVKGDVKLIMINDMLVSFQRIRALRDIYCEELEANGKTRKIKVASKGDLGAYIVRGTLNQEDNAWAKPIVVNGKIKQECLIGPNCKISGNAIVEGCVLAYNVKVSDYAELFMLNIRPKKGASFSGNSSVRFANVLGDAFLKGNACIYQSDVIGSIHMNKNTFLYDCYVKSKQARLNMDGNKKYSHNAIKVRRNENGSVIYVTDRNGKSF